MEECMSSRSSKRRKRAEARARAKAQSIAVTSKDQKSKSETHDKAQSQQGPVSFLNSDRIDQVLVWFFGVAVGALMNHISTSPNIMYFSSIVFIAFAIRKTWGLSRAWRFTTWVGCCILFFGFHKYVQGELDDRFSGALIPANDPTPTNQIGFPKVPKEATTVLLVGSSISWAETFPHAVVKFKGKDLLVLSTNAIGATVSAEFFDRDGNIVAELVSNKFKINQLNHFGPPERPDKSTLIVRDQQNIEILNIRFMNPRCIRIWGHLRLPGEPDIIMSSNRLSYGNAEWIDSVFRTKGADIVIE